MSSVTQKRTLLSNPNQSMHPPLSALPQTPPHKRQSSGRDDAGRGAVAQGVDVALGGEDLSGDVEICETRGETPRWPAVFVAEALMSINKSSQAGSSS